MKRRLIALLVLAGIVPAVLGGIAAAGTSSSDARKPHDHASHSSTFQGTPVARTCASRSTGCSASTPRSR